MRVGYFRKLMTIVVMLCALFSMELAACGSTSTVADGGQRPTRPPIINDAPTVAPVFPTSTPTTTVSGQNPTQPSRKANTPTPIPPTSIPTPTPIPPTPTVQVNSFSTASVVDDWSSGIVDPNIWDVFGGGQVNVVNGHLQIASTLSGDDSGVSTHKRPLDFTGSYAFVEVIDAGNQQLQSWGCYPVAIGIYSPAPDQYYWSIQNGQIHAILETSVQGVAVRQDTYDPAIHKYFRIRESQGIIYWDYSTNGSSWVNYTSHASTFDVTRVVVGANAGNYLDEASTTSCIIDNFNKA